jgi:hypothetical protein
MKPLEYISKEKPSIVGTYCRMSSLVDDFPEKKDTKLLLSMLFVSIVIDVPA